MVCFALDPPRQGEVIVRDVEGLTADEACRARGLSVTNRRFLLYRGHSRLPGMLETQMRTIK
jgi:DNA-directed RNA polymerase specialized sigma24 family protein